VDCSDNFKPRWGGSVILSPFQGLQIERGYILPGVSAVALRAMAGQAHPRLIDFHPFGILIKIKKLQVLHELHGLKNQ
jgi:hypothetical protein